jgi:hypothetical protein
MPPVLVLVYPTPRKSRQFRKRPHGYAQPYVEKRGPRTPRWSRNARNSILLCSHRESSVSAHDLGKSRVVVRAGVATGTPSCRLFSGNETTDLH